MDARAAAPLASRTLAAHPRGTSFRVALRSSRRVNEREGVPLEDLGVEADQLHEVTRRNITERNQDLLAVAGDCFSKRDGDRSLGPLPRSPRCTC